MSNYKLFNEYKDKLKKELDIKVIYSDLDGTLFNDVGCIIKDENGKFFFGAIQLIKKIELKGWDLVLVSGRSKVQLRYNAMMIGVRNYIPELGCEMIYDLGNEVHIAFDKNKYNYSITNGGKDLKKIIRILKDSFPGKIESRIEWSMGRYYNALFFGQVNTDMANKILFENGYENLVLVDNGFSKLAKLSLDVDHLRIYNIIPRGVDKSSAIKLDKKIRNFNKNNCIALGDSIEDIKMAKEVGAFFLMRDAIERDEGIINLIDKYDNIFVTTKRMNHGWTEVVGYLLGL